MAKETVAQATARIILTDLYEAWCGDGGRGFTVERLGAGIALADTILTEVSAVGHDGNGRRVSTGDILFEAARRAGADLGSDPDSGATRFGS
jgi:hypothetical protein